MPIYVVTDTTTNDTYEVNMKWSELEQLLKDHPNLKKEITAPNIVSGVGSIKKDGGWTDMLKTIKKASGSGNTIDV
jgi:hypothetical protein|tara:strand:+ start:621 stop:848 length:228 start_codon:yes stop_codon:yes gene_type:complete